MKTPVQLWLASIEAWKSEEGSISKILTPQEKIRAAQFLFSKDRSRWTITRALLRHILGHSLGVDGQDIVFGNGQFGKPHISYPSFSSIKFNVSHSGEWALIGLHDSLPVGVDVEWINPGINMMEIAQRFFSESDIQFLGHDLRNFYSLWTMKEACLKEWGAGLQIPLREVSFVAAEDKEYFVGAGPEDKEWHVFTKQIDHCHLAAVAHQERLECIWREILPEQDGFVSRFMSH